MIARLRGHLVSKDPTPVVEVGGLGLSVQVSARTAAALPATGGDVTLLTYLHVREDNLSLYGFSNERERSLFLLLLSVSGIGPRVALTILSSAALEELERAVAEEDAAWLTRLPGLGRKTAARLVVELQGKLVAPSEEIPAARVEPVLEEAVLALTSLGMVPRAARQAIDKLDREHLGDSPRVEDIVKAALQTGARK